MCVREAVNDVCVLEKLMKKELSGGHKPPIIYTYQEDACYDSIEKKRFISAYCSFDS